jgi:fumarate reductase subunit C
VLVLWWEDGQQSISIYKRKHIIKKMVNFYHSFPSLKMNEPVILALNVTSLWAALLQSPSFVSSEYGGVFPTLLQQWRACKEPT